MTDPDPSKTPPDALTTKDGHDDPRSPGVRRRLWKSQTTECKCSKCGKWSGFGLIEGYAPPYVYVCPECLP
jgi:hypothetical protein